MREITTQLARTLKVVGLLNVAPAQFAWVQASVVGFTLSSAEIEECRALAASLGVERFRVR